VGTGSRLLDHRGRDGRRRDRRRAVEQRRACCAAEFVAWVQVLIYIGAIVVLFLFGIMLTRAPMREESGKLDNNQRLAAGVVGLFLFGVLVVFLVDAFGNDEIKFDKGLVALGKTQSVGDSIFRTYVIPFEVVSMLLLAALVGAVVLARRD
jgi:NADH-quinone oxidoreductase subunit J